MALIDTVVAGLHSSNDLDFISVADIAASVDVPTMVSVQQVNMIVNVFHLLHIQQDLGRPTEPLPRAIDIESIDREPEDEMPQAKVIFLPSKELRGVWNSYAITSLPCRIN